MAVPLNSILGFNSTAQTKYQHLPKAYHCSSLLRTAELRTLIKGKDWRLFLSVSNGDRVVTDTSDKGSKDAERSFSDDKSSAVNLPSSDSPTRNEVSEGSNVSSDLNQDPSSPNVKFTLKRSSLTAREKVRAARILSRYPESKTTKRELGSKVLEALRESDGGKKRSGLPEAPTNLFDDSKRGMPKQGLTFEFPGGVDVFVVVFSFVFISTVMFATTYIVWKVGAIHFNEY